MLYLSDNSGFNFTSQKRRILMNKRHWFKAGAILTAMIAFTLVAGVALADGAMGAKGGSAGEGVPVLDPDDLMEGFEDITNLPGWFMQNNSDPLGTTDWFQGNDAVFPAQAGPPTSYIGANFNNTAGGTGTISNWLLTPVLGLNDGDEISFWTRSPAGSIWADRVELRMSTNGASTDVGTAATDVGDFTTLLLSVNPNLIPDGYPQVWTEFTDTLSGIGAASVDGRLAWRYFVTDGGPSGVNSNYIGIDTVVFTDAATAAIDFTKTVGTDPNACATTSSISVPAGQGGTDVTYCYTMENTGGITATYHTVVDDQLGTILGPGYVADVAPGATVYFTESVNITQTTVNTATWTVTDAAGATLAEDSDSATVTQLPPTGVSLSSFDARDSVALAPFWLAALAVVIVVGFAVRRKIAVRQ
jgi:hypothetical protein